MITEKFINDIVIVLINEDTGRNIIKIVNNIFNNLFRKLKIDEVKGISAIDILKIEMIESILNFRYKKEDSYIFDTLIDFLSGGKFSPFIDYLKDLYNNITDDVYNDSLSSILIKYRYLSFSDSINEIEGVIKEIKNNSFSRQDELIDKVRLLSNKLNQSIFLIEREEGLNGLMELDVNGDNYDCLWKEILSSFSSSSVIPTGYNFFDVNLPMGGFEPKRLYLIAGTSGIGKSLFLLNLLVNAVKKEEKKKEQDKKSLYVYITAENLIDESFIRLYCAMFSVPYRNFMRELRNIKKNNGEEEVRKYLDGKRKKIKDYLDKKNADIILKYFPANVTSTSELKNYLNSLKEVGNIRAIYIDYLDLFNCNFKPGEVRFELGFVTQEFKKIAIEHFSPVITATQLNRSGYITREDSSLTQISESLEKINKSDCVIFIQSFPPEESKVEIEGVVYRKLRVSIMKQRNGSTDESDVFYYKLHKMGNNLESLFDYRVIDIPIIGNNNSSTIFNNTGIGLFSNSIDVWSG